MSNAKKHPRFNVFLDPADSQETLSILDGDTNTEEPHPPPRETDGLYGYTDVFDQGHCCHAARCKASGPAAIPLIHATVARAASAATACDSERGAFEDNAS